MTNSTRPGAPTDDGGDVALSGHAMTPSIPVAEARVLEMMQAASDRTAALLCELGDVVAEWVEAMSLYDRAIGPGLDDDTLTEKVQRTNPMLRPLWLAANLLAEVCAEQVVIWDSEIPVGELLPASVLARLDAARANRAFRNLSDATEPGKSSDPVGMQAL